MAYIQLDELKKHLNIETSFNEDDLYLSTLIDVAELSIQEYCNGGLNTYTDNVPITVKHATLILAAHLYINRTVVSFAQALEIPYSFKFLLNPYRIYTIN